MPARLVALDEGPDIVLDRTMVVVGRHPQCDARLDSLRVSRRHCCMAPDHGEVVVRDLGSTNGIRINGQRVEVGRLRPGDELSIAHIRYRLDAQGNDDQVTLADQREPGDGPRLPELESNRLAKLAAVGGENPLAAAVRAALAGLPEAQRQHLAPDRCRIQIVVQVPPQAEVPVPAPAGAAESDEACRPDSSP